MRGRRLLLRNWRCKRHTGCQSDLRRRPLENRRASLRGRRSLTRHRKVRVVRLDTCGSDRRNIATQLRHVHRLAPDRQHPHIRVGRDFDVVNDLNAPIIIRHRVQMEWRVRHDTLRRLHAPLKLCTIDTEHAQSCSFAVGIRMHRREELCPRLGLGKQRLGAKYLDYVRTAEGR